jgi:hypothetical protein
MTHHRLNLIAGLSALTLGLVVPLSAQEIPERPTPPPQPSNGTAAAPGQPQSQPALPDENDGTGAEPKAIGPDIPVSLPPAPVSQPVTAPTKTANVATPEPGSTDRSRETKPAGDASTYGAAGSQGTASRPNAPAGAVADNSHAAVPHENLTPTGRTSADPYPVAAAGAGNAAVAVRLALDQDESLRGVGVRVIPDQGRVALRGAVTSEQTKRRIEAVARKAADGAAITNEITVENR